VAVRLLYLIFRQIMAWRGDDRTAIGVPGAERSRRSSSRVGESAAHAPTEVFPGALGLFADLDSRISLRFLSRFDSQDRADWLTPARLSA
jgi:transposase